MVRRGCSSRFVPHLNITPTEASLDPKKVEPISGPRFNVRKALPPVSRSYVERPEIQANMTFNLLPTGEQRRQPRCILHGMGGAGKTQLAANWMKEHEKR